MSAVSRYRRVFVLMLGLTFAVWSPAGAAPVEVSYGIDMSPGTSNGNDITNVFIFESNGAQFSVDHGFVIRGSGVSRLTHTSPFAPTSTLIAGIGRGIAGVGDGQDHIYMIVNDDFAESIVGTPWSQLFPGSGGVRVRHSEFVDLLTDAGAGDEDALEAVLNFVRVDAAAAWFDSDGPFSVSEFSTPPPPVGGSVPAPGTLALLAAALAGLGVRAIDRRKRVRRMGA